MGSVSIGCAAVSEVFSSGRMMIGGMKSIPSVS